MAAEAGFRVSQAVTPVVDLSTLEKVNILTREFKRDPYPFYARLRAERPVCRTRVGAFDAYLVTRYDDVVAVLKDARFAKDRFRVLTPEQLRRQPWIPKFVLPLTRNMLDLDDPEHARLRNLVHKAFTPAMVEKMSGRIRQIAAGLLDRLAARGEMDLVRDYALPIPLTVIVDLLGIPARDRDRFHHWSRAMLRVPTHFNMLLALPSMLAFQRYLKKEFERVRHEPNDGLLTALVQAEEAGDRLSSDELLAMAFLLLIAGHETTVNLIASGMLALLEHPEEMERLRRDPSLIRSAIEELLRFTSPLETATGRFAVSEASVAGTTFPAGTMVFAVIASANRDVAQFPDPDRLDLGRDPNRHLAFGVGAHFCLGASLARMEGAIAINALLERLPGLHLAARASSLRWRTTPVLRGLEALPVRW